MPPVILLVVVTEGVGPFPGRLAGRQVIEFVLLASLLGVAGVTEGRVERR